MPAPNMTKTGTTPRGMTGKDTAAPVMTATAWIARDTTRQGTTVRVSIVSIFDDDGYDRQGFDADGYDRSGRDKRGSTVTALMWTASIASAGTQKVTVVTASSLMVTTVKVMTEGYGRDRYNASRLDRAGHCRQYYSDHIEQLRDRLDEAYQQLQR